MLAVSTPVEYEPLTGSSPLHPPVAAQEDASVADHVIVDAPPLTIVLGFTLSAIVGDGDSTETVTDCEACPPAPTQANP
jgi:hypothetical protein